MNKLVFGSIVISLFVAGGCKKKDKAATTDDKPAGSATVATPGSGTAAADKPADPVGAGSAPAAPPGKSELTSAVFMDKQQKEGKAGPLPFDQQLWVDDGHGNSQVYLMIKCSKAPDPCALAKYDILYPDLVAKHCDKDVSMVHIAFAPPKEERKANMGPVTIKPGKYAAKNTNPTVMLEYTNPDSSITGQSYQEEPYLEVTQVGDTLAGTFDTKFQAGPVMLAYKGAFNAKKCTCDKGSGECK